MRLNCLIVLVLSLLAIGYARASVASFEGAKMAGFVEFVASSHDAAHLTSGSPSLNTEAGVIDEMEKVLLSAGVPNIDVDPQPYLSAFRRLSKDAQQQVLARASPIFLRYQSLQGRLKVLQAKGKPLAPAMPTVTPPPGQLRFGEVPPAERAAIAEGVKKEQDEAEARAIENERRLSSLIGAQKEAFLRQIRSAEANRFRQFRDMEDRFATLTPEARNEEWNKLSPAARLRYAINQRYTLQQESQRPLILIRGAIAWRSLPLKEGNMLRRLY